MDGFIGAWTPWLRITEYELFTETQYGSDPYWNVRLRFEAYFASMLTAGTFPC